MRSRRLVFKFQRIEADANVLNADVWGIIKSFLVPNPWWMVWDEVMYDLYMSYECNRRTTYWQYTGPDQWHQGGWYAVIAPEDSPLGLGEILWPYPLIFPLDLGNVEF